MEGEGIGERERSTERMVRGRQEGLRERWGHKREGICVWNQGGEGRRKAQTEGGGEGFHGSHAPHVQVDAGDLEAAGALEHVLQAGDPEQVDSRLGTSAANTPCYVS